MTKGILAFGAYIPWRRLPRMAIAETHGWFNPALKGQAKGERAFCNWDEDAVTMAVEAARDALMGRDRSRIAALRFASTTFPFLDRLHSGIVAGALSLPEDISAIDVTATQRAGTSALIEALAGGGETLVVASEKRGAKAASPIEMASGDGAAAVLVGEGRPVATLLAKASRTTDFVDHFRSVDNQFDYQWEERWIRDAGYMSTVPPAVKRCLEQGGVAPKDVTHFCMPATLARVANGVAKACGIEDKAVCDPLHANCGDTGAAHTLMLLERGGEKHERVRGAGIAAVGVQRIAHRLVLDAARLGDPVGDPRQGRRHAEVRHVLGRNAALLEAPLDGRRHRRHVAGIADPALLPLVVELVVDGAEVVDEIGGARSLGQQRGDRPALADEDGRGAVAARHLDGARSLGAALLGRDHQRLAAAGQRLDQRRRARALRGRDVDGGDVLGQAQRARDDPRVQTVEKRKGGGGEAQRGDAAPVAAHERVAGGLHGHRHRVLVPVAEGALALGLPLERRIEPAVRLGDRLARKPAPRDVGAERENALGHYRP